MQTAGSGDNSSFVVKVTDFGLCDLFTAEGPLIGEMGGTLTHVAPEVATQQKVRHQPAQEAPGSCSSSVFHCPAGHRKVK